MNMHIILVDDHKLFAKSLEISLKGQVDKFEVYTSPEQLSKVLESRVPDILLLDIHMGDYNGFDVAREVLESYADLKIIFLSGYDLVEYHNRAIEIGAKGFIHKNISLHDLVDQIERVRSGGMIFPRSSSDIVQLTAREKEVLQLMAEGLRQQDVADRLFISRRTVNNHIQMINEKFHVNSTVSAIVKGIELGIVTLNFRT
ncbi:response regulator transcription factor [Saccharibacillus kuerlensis]|uniref:DNA-binding response regulator n=1 Tax=Saccharibacillus kuerlensis TaxID=459527 RepID=A0ABQ2LDA7_9BACL|nr:response regulator transcription factor [Saccharibacillus kuerlensis]GGO09022.1 DNA-binding response regulator [Saccharibacillus kuerlensis]